MTTKRTFLLTLLLLSELIIIFFLLKWIVLKESQDNQVSLSQIQKGNKIFPSKHYSYYYEPLQNSHQEHKKPSWLSTTPAYDINADTLRENKDYTTQKPKDTFRIITLGDSFTYGIYVDLENTYPKKLETLLNTKTCNPYKHFEVINLGIPGQDMAYIRERFRIRGQKYNSDLILLLLKDDDFFEPSELIYKKINENTNDKPIETRWTDALNTIYSEKGGKEEIVVQEMSELTGLRNDYNGKIVIFSLDYLHAPEKELNDFAAKSQNSYYIGKIKLTGNETAFPDFHPTEKAHAQIARYLSDYLSKNFISCR